MIVALGTDIVNVARIAKTYNRFGKRFVQRILASYEQQQFYARTKKIHYLAKRFAAKEAASKALGTGIAHKVDWRSIVVLEDKNGKPSLRFDGGAEQALNKIGARQALLSISDEKEYAFAVVILSR